MLSKLTPIDDARLKLERRKLSQLRSQEVWLRMHACGVCSTDLHVVEGELTHPELQVVPGHVECTTVSTVANATPRCTSEFIDLAGDAGVDTQV